MFGADFRPVSSQWAGLPSSYICDNIVSAEYASGACRPNPAQRPCLMDANENEV